MIPPPRISCSSDQVHVTGFHEANKYFYTIMIANAENSPTDFSITILELPVEAIPLIGTPVLHPSSCEVPGKQQNWSELRNKLSSAALCGPIQIQNI